MAPPRLRYVQLYPTVRCNQRCFFCFNGHLSSGKGALPDLSLPDAMRLLRILEDQGAEEIDVMGGEPLLLPWIPFFAQKASERGMKVNISTNGSFPASMARFKDSQNVTIGVSLEGSSEERHNTITASSHFSLAMDTIDKLISLGLDLAVKTVVSRTIAPDIPKITGLLRSLGIRRYHLIHMDILTGLPAIMKEALSYPRFSIFCDHIRDMNSDMEILTVSASCFTKELIGYPVRCSGGVNKLSILPDGSVFPCNLFHGFPDFLLGNILQDDFALLWTNPRLDTFRDAGARSCNDRFCTNRNSCTGGCPAHNRYHYGNLGGRDVRCRLSSAGSDTGLS
ncbi:MAG: radical SAM protein [Candidatus Sulfobium sp.]|jgi:radical SAM protein with 4Fe4S-binding SPASM domain